MALLSPDDNAFPSMSGTRGLSVRAELAKAAMQGLLANTRMPVFEPYSDMAAWAVKAADALIEELNKPRKKAE